MHSVTVVPHCLQGGEQYLASVEAVLDPTKLPLYKSLISKAAEFSKNYVAALNLTVKSVEKSPILVIVNSLVDVNTQVADRYDSEQVELTGVKSLGTATVTETSEVSEA